MTTLFVEQPLALPCSGNKMINSKLNIPSYIPKQYFKIIYWINKQTHLYINLKEIKQCRKSRLWKCHSWAHSMFETNYVHSKKKKYIAKNHLAYLKENIYWNCHTKQYQNCLWTLQNPNNTWFWQNSLNLCNTHFYNCWATTHCSFQIKFD